MPNTYPTLSYTTGLMIDRRDGRVDVRATNGALKSRLLYPSDKRNFQIQHELDSTARQTLETFYTNNRDLSIYYTPPGETTQYTVRFMGPPLFTPMGTGLQWWVAQVRLSEV